MITAHRFFRRYNLSKTKGIIGYERSDKYNIWKGRPYATQQKARKSFSKYLYNILFDEEACKRRQVLK